LLLQHNEIGKFQEFIREHWDKNHLFAKETFVFDWQHKNPTINRCISFVTIVKQVVLHTTYQADAASHGKRSEGW